MDEKPISRRLAAILAADVVGFSRLTERDEEGTLARLKALRQDLIDPTVANHHGRLVKTTGDGLLIEFASVVDAVRGAIEVQRAMALENATVAPEQRIDFRIGINLGDIVVDGDDVLGDGVNVAARLEGIAAPGGISISADAFHQVEGKVAAAFADTGEHSLKNIARPVRVYRIDLDGAPAAGDFAASPADHAAIAVLPFTNMSGDPEQEYFADGMVEDIITGLSRIKWLAVIARNSSFVYKGKAVDMKQVGRELGVRYVLEGSVRKVGNRVRITGQLIESATGRHLWAERYDRALDDIFELQDEITLNVVGAIEPNLRAAETERVKRKRPDSLDAYDLVLQASALAASTTTEDATRALELLERALVLEPGYTGAHALMAHCYRAIYLRGDGREEDRAAAVHHARAEIAKGCDDATALAVAGLVLYQLDHDDAIALDLCERALALSPSSMIALGSSAVVLAWLGKLDLSIERAERARRLSPFDPFIFLPLTALAIAHFRAGRFAESAEAARRGFESNPLFPVSGALLAGALVRLGRIDEAKATIERAAAGSPGVKLGDWFQRAAIGEAFTPFMAAMREAGIAE